MWKVLIVEDSIPDQELLKEFLKGKADLDCADDGWRGYKKYRESCEKKKYYDIILLDLAMPRMTGCTLVSLIRENESKFGDQKIPIIVITSCQDALKKAVEAGCDDYIIKPVEKERLLLYIERLIYKYLPAT